MNRIVLAALIFIGCASAVAQVSDKPLTFVSKVGETYTFSRSDLTITATCIGALRVRQNCIYAGLPGAVYHEDNSQTCEGYSKDEIRYAIQNDLSQLLLVSFKKGCNDPDWDRFKIVTIKRK